MTRLASALVPILLVGMVACGDGPTAPALDPEASVSLGGYHACALSPDGQATCWGVNGDGQVGNGKVGGAALPSELLGGLEFTTITSGFAHSCGLTEDGVAFCWGSNGGGRLGIGNVTFTPEPIKISGDLVFASMSAGQAHTCGATIDNIAYCWGSNTFGELGTRDLAPDCNGTCSATPIEVDAPFSIQSITAGNTHTCALTTDGVAYCWGNNGDGQLGNGTLVGSPLPVLVLGGHTFTRLDAGGAHTCGLLTTGSVLCWGRNSSGQLGDPTVTQDCPVTGAACSSSPRVVDTDLVFNTLSAGGAHTCAIAEAGTSHCWGGNRRGQLGNGEVFDVPVPQQVLGGLMLQSLDTGAEHTCGVSVDTEVYCWGDNFRRQLGTGSSAFRYLEPIFILSLSSAP
jgi:alpha-tubulin suppressor-like RCC1 family protein